MHSGLVGAALTVNLTRFMFTCSYHTSFYLRYDRYCIYQFLFSPLLLFHIFPSSLADHESRAQFVLDIALNGRQFSVDVRLPISPSCALSSNAVSCQYFKLSQRVIFQLASPSSAKHFLSWIILISLLALPPIRCRPHDVCTVLDFQIRICYHTLPLLHGHSLDH